MSNPQAGCVVVGAGLAGATVVQTLREEGFAEPITLIGEENERPYERPPLSKGYLQGLTPISELYVHPPEWYADHDVRTLFGEQVVRINRSTSEVQLGSGATVRYRRLVLATGASPRHLDLPGTQLAGVHTLRRIEDSTALRAELAPGRRLVVIGAGWIGLEVAAAARLAGCHVTVLETAQVPLGRILGSQLGEYFAALHRRHGVELRTGVTVSTIVGSAGRVSGVATRSDIVPADLVLIAVGVTPNTRLAEEAGLAVSNGITVDEQLLSSDPAVLAAGDVADAQHAVLGHHVRVEHWDNAIRHGQLAARTILGGSGRYDWQPYFYTDQYDLGMEYVGHSQPDDHVTIHGDTASGTFIAVWTRNSIVTAAMNVNVWDVNDQLRNLVGHPLSVNELPDPQPAG